MKFETKEYNFELDQNHLRVSSNRKTQIQDIQIPKINHVQCDSETRDTTIIGLLFFLIGFISLVMVNMVPIYAKSATIVGALSIILGLLLVVSKSHTTILTISLMGGGAYSYETSKDHQVFIDLMDSINDLLS